MVHIETCAIKEVSFGKWRMKWKVVEFDQALLDGKAKGCPIAYACVALLLMRMPRRELKTRADRLRLRERQGRALSDWIYIAVSLYTSQGLFWGLPWTHSVAEKRNCRYWKIAADLARSPRRVSHLWRILRPSLHFPLILIQAHWDCITLCSAAMLLIPSPVDRKHIKNFGGSCTIDVWNLSRVSKGFKDDNHNF